MEFLFVGFGRMRIGSLIPVEDAALQTFSQQQTFAGNKLFHRGQFRAIFFSYSSFIALFQGLFLSESFPLLGHLASFFRFCFHEGPILLQLTTPINICDFTIRGCRRTGDITHVI